MQILPGGKEIEIRGGMAIARSEICGVVFPDSSVSGVRKKENEKDIIPLAILYDARGYYQKNWRLE